MSIADEITVEELDRDPYPIYARMRREEPVCFVPAVGLWFVTRWADVEHAASHPELFDSTVTLRRSSVRWAATASSCSTASRRSGFVRCSTRRCGRVSSRRRHPSS